MSRKELYENKLQMDYFSEDYIRFEEDFQKYSAMDVPLTFLIDDILRTMAMNQKNYFKLNKENFLIKMLNNSEITRKYFYQYHTLK